MIIKSVRVRNFRCIRDETLECKDLTVLVGPNGSGKSSFLRAIELFYALQTRVTEEDFYNKDTSQHIVIGIVFDNLTQQESELYSPYLDDNTLTVEKQIDFPGGKGNERYFGSKMQNPDFQGVRVPGTATVKRQAYNLLREQYSELPSITRADDIEPALAEWEQSHPERCQRTRDSGQFFGFEAVGNTRLERFTKFFLVPAVRDASEDAMEGKGSCLTDLMDLVVKQVLRQKPELEQFRTEMRERYEELVDEGQLPELPQLADDLTRTLQTYIQDARVALEWIIGEPSIPIPTACASLVEDDYKGDVSKKGHGLQRTFILTLLQYLTIIKGTREVEAHEDITELTEDTVRGQGGTAATTVIPNLVIAIEEPELYQHPNRQRHLAKVFLQLAEGGLEGSEHVQIIYSTHSPLFVGIERFDKIRLFKKEEHIEGSPKETKVKFVTMGKIAEKLEEARGLTEGAFTASSLQARLMNLMTPLVNEGFFANVVVLVEGESDQCAILEVGRQIGMDFEKFGISVISVGGKTNLAAPSLIFAELGIPVYIVFDCDRSRGVDGKPEINKLLLKLCGYSEEDFPETDIRGNLAHFKEDLETIFRDEIGSELYNQLREQYGHELGFRAEEGAKNPLVIRKIVQDVYGRGNKIETLENIANSVVALRR